MELGKPTGAQAIGKIWPSDLTLYGAIVGQRAELDSPMPSRRGHPAAHAVMRGIMDCEQSPGMGWCDRAWSNRSRRGAVPMIRGYRRALLMAAALILLSQNSSLPGCQASNRKSQTSESHRASAGIRAATSVSSSGLSSAPGTRVVQGIQRNPQRTATGAANEGRGDDH